MNSLSHGNQADVIEAFNLTSWYLDDFLNIDYTYFEGMVKEMYSHELQLNKANTTYTEASFLDLHISIATRFVSSKINDKRDVFDFDIVNFPFSDGGVPCRASYVSETSKTFSKFYRHYELISKLNIGLDKDPFTRGPFGTNILW